MSASARQRCSHNETFVPFCLSVGGGPAPTHGALARADTGDKIMAMRSFTPMDIVNKAAPQDNRLESTETDDAHLYHGV